MKKSQEVLSCKWLLAQGNTVYNDEDVWTCGMSCSAPVVKAALITYYAYLVIRAANLNLFSLLWIVDPPFYHSTTPMPMRQSLG